MSAGMSACPGELELQIESAVKIIRAMQRQVHF
jgi:hypothetical protein